MQNLIIFRRSLVQDLETNPKCSLLVSRDASDISDTVVTIIGEAETVSCLTHLCNIL